jgi:hypothetical protein
MVIKKENFNKAKGEFISLILILFLLAAFLCYEAFESRSDFKTTSGRVTGKGYRKERTRGLNHTYYYYFSLNSHPQEFGISTNKELEVILDPKFKGLNIGDIIKVTYTDNNATKNSSVNLGVGEIEREGIVLYSRIFTSPWNGRMKLSLTLLILGMSLMGLFFYIRSIAV